MVYLNTLNYISAHIKYTSPSFQWIISFYCLLLGSQCMSAILTACNKKSYKSSCQKWQVITKRMKCINQNKGGECRKLKINVTGISLFSPCFKFNSGH